VACGAGGGGGLDMCIVVKLNVATTACGGLSRTTPTSIGGAGAKFRVGARYIGTNVMRGNL